MCRFHWLARLHSLTSWVRWLIYQHIAVASLHSQRFQINRYMLVSVVFQTLYFL